MKEQDIRPEHLLRRYLELSAEDAEACFRGVPRAAVPCVACAATQAEESFEKNGFAYVSCVACRTLYQSPRPTLAAFESFYRDSRSSNYWASEFYPAVAEARRERIFRPRAARLAGLCAARGIAVDTLIDVGAGYGVFLDEWRTLRPATRCVAVEPGARLAAECRAKGFEVIETIVEHAQGLAGQGDVVTCFEVLEHVHDPLAFVRTLGSLVRPGGCLLVSTLGIDGFDLQVLWERSNAIFPPHHINFLSRQGFRALFQRAGLVDVEVLTPGVLDVDIVRNARRADPEVLASDRFLRNLLEDGVASAKFQEFLSASGLSSHTWIIARRPASEVSP